ncbi:MAG TPA: hypothetical protein P5236_04010, partial [Paludibacteraceae bacterium]|nr:hypothetical protein [Paludibacteraceae bacterium]
MAISPKNDPVEKKIDKLISRMTLEEKIGQMNQISSFGSVETMEEFVKNGSIGSIINEIDPVNINALQRIAVN